MQLGAWTRIKYFLQTNSIPPSGRSVKGAKLLIACRVQEFGGTLASLLSPQPSVFGGLSLSKCRKAGETSAGTMAIEAGNSKERGVLSRGSVRATERLGR
jgi:hypothetical protein